MRRVLVLLVALVCWFPAIAQSDRLTGRPQIQSQPSDKKKAADKPFAWPLQLEMRVPFEPTAFPNRTKSYLMYELYLTNFGTTALSLSRIEVLDGNSESGPPVAIFEAEQLKTMLQPLGKTASEDKLALAGGQSGIVFVSIAVGTQSAVPNRVVHRVSTVDATLKGAVIETHHTKLPLFGAPLEGANWLAADGPSNEEDNHHRRGVIVLEGHPTNSRRYAVDWKKIKDGASYSGNSLDVRSYFSYGETVLAVADGRVITAQDGLPDNIPGHGESFHPAAPITLETVAGNSITLDTGGGQFAYYMHLQPGSLRVKAGDRVRRGQVLGRVGASGDAREPHLHFEVTTSPRLLLGEGVPYLIDRYRSQSHLDGQMEVHLHELPLGKDVVEFEEKRVK